MMIAETAANLPKILTLAAAIAGSGYWIYRERLRVNKFKTDNEFHLLKFIAKDGRKLAIYKAKVEEGEETEIRKTVWRKFLGHNITEEEAKELFSGNTVKFSELTSRKGNRFSADGKLEFDDDRNRWFIKLSFDRKEINQIKKD